MTIYKDKSGKSGIESYDIGEDHLDVKFKSSDKVYTYIPQDVGGKDNLEILKEAAKFGKNLNSMINKCRQLAQVNMELED